MDIHSNCNCSSTMLSAFLWSIGLPRDCNEKSYSVQKTLYNDAKGLLAASRTCSRCHSNMLFVTEAQRNRWMPVSGTNSVPILHTMMINYAKHFYQLLNNYRWKCSTHGCRKAKSMRHNSWFTRSHLSIEQILEQTLYWAEDRLKL